jgi:hypothetical protein
MSIVSVGAGLLAGILSTLSPCVFPLLPLVIGLDQNVFRTASAILLMLLGVALLSTALQARLGAAAGGLSSAGDRLIRRLGLTSRRGRFLAESCSASSGVLVQVPPSAPHPCSPLSARIL